MFVAISIVSADSAWSSDSGAGRPVTVADSIEMTHIGQPWADLVGKAPASFSPNGRQFVVTVRKGNVAANVNEYSLLWFSADQAFRQPAPRVLAQVASASNHPGISDARWLDDDTLLFLEARNDEPRQLVALALMTGKTTRLTNHATDVLAFDATAQLGTITYLARPRTQSYWNDRTEREGLLISDQYLGNLLAGHPWEEDDLGVLNALNVYMHDREAVLERLDMANYKPFGALSISPSGQWTIMRAWVSKDDMLPAWSAFKEAMAPDRAVAIYVVADKDSRTARPLIDVPVAEYEHSNLAWTSNDTVVVANTYLPIGATGGGDPEARFTAEINLATGAIASVARGTHRLIGWDAGRRTLCLRTLMPDAIWSSSGDEVCNVHDLQFHKKDLTWERLRTAPKSNPRPIEVTIEQGLNAPPRLAVRKVPSGRRALLLDPNPQFRNLRFARVEEMEWKTAGGETYIGGLYYPLDYASGKRYPLIIQTHGWRRGQFSVDGPSSAGYAAQILAGKGFFVAQLPDDGRWEGTAEEGPRYMAMHEGVVEYLSDRGFIDTTRMAIQGWSRTGYHVRYTLTFSRHRFAAAAIADGMDASYGQYLSFLNIGKEAVGAYEAMNGSAPFGGGLQNWIDRATGFNLDKVDTPTRLLTFVPSMLLNNWEWFAGLKYLGKPVELVWLRRAAHTPVLPGERKVAQQGNVDWFDFWVNGREDAAPEKAEQYMRWRALRDQGATRGDHATERLPHSGGISE